MQITGTPSDGISKVIQDMIFILFSNLPYCSELTYAAIQHGPPRTGM